MNHPIKQLAALLCAAWIVFSLLPVRVWALEMDDACLYVSETCGNPLYPQPDSREASYDEPGTAALADTGTGDGISFADAASAGAHVARQYKTREGAVFFYTGYPTGGPFLALTADEENAAYSDAEQTLAEQGASHASILTRRRFLKYLRQLVTEDILPAAFRHDPGDPTGGDYMRTQYQDVTYTAAYDGYTYGISITFTYLTTAAQDAELTQAAAALLDFLRLEGKTDYARLQAIYGWICGHVTYDYEHLKDDTYPLKYSAYAALVDKTAVCQGYAALLYRLALAAGVDIRIVTGTGNGAPHGWNLVKLGSLWYYADATWDAGYQSWSYFLRPSLPYHVLDDASAALVASCPLSSTAFAVKAGQLNGDSRIDIQDVQLLYTYLLTGSVPAGGTVLPDGDFQLAADVNADGYVDVYDLQTLYEIACGIA